LLLARRILRRVLGVSRQRADVPKPPRKAKPFGHKAYAQQAVIEQKSGNHHKALTLYLIAASLAPNNHAYAERVGRAFARLGEDTSALFFLRRAAVLRSGVVQSPALIDRLENRLARRLSPPVTAEHHAALATNAARQGDWNGSADHLFRALFLDSSNPVYADRLGRSLYRCGKFAMAHEYLNRAKALSGGRVLSDTIIRKAEKQMTAKDRRPVSL
jgi:tetratricopeptide (TPR) repeat protein